MDQVCSYIILLSYSILTLVNSISRMEPILGCTYFGSEALLKCKNKEFEYYKSLFTLPTEDMHFDLNDSMIDINELDNDLEAIVIFTRNLTLVRQLNI